MMGEIVMSAGVAVAGAIIVTVLLGVGLGIYLMYREWCEMKDEDDNDRNRWA